MEYYIIMCQTIPSCRYEVGIQYRERKLFDKEVVKSDRKFFDDVKITDLHNSEMLYPPLPVRKYITRMSLLFRNCQQISSMKETIAELRSNQKTILTLNNNAS
jgi:hypothetical protein